MADQISGLLSPFLRSRRIKIARPHLTGKVLDYGCGIGLLSEMVNMNDYTGVDIDDESIQTARKRYPGFNFLNLNDLPNNGSYETIVCLAVIEHLPSPQRVFNQFKGLLAANGKIVLTTPHPSFDWIHVLGAKFKLFSQEGRDDHENLFNKDSLFQLAAKTGFNISLYRRFLFGANQLVIMDCSALQP